MRARLHLMLHLMLHLILHPMYIFCVIVADDEGDDLDDKLESSDGDPNEVLLDTEWPKRPAEYNSDDDWDGELKNNHIESTERFKPNEYVVLMHPGDTMGYAKFKLRIAHASVVALRKIRGGVCKDPPSMYALVDELVVVIQMLSSDVTSAFLFTNVCNLGKEVRLDVRRPEHLQVPGEGTPHSRGDG